MLLVTTMLLVIAAVMFDLERIMYFRLLTQTRVGLGLVVWVNTGVEDSWSVQLEMQAYSLEESQDLHGGISMQLSRIKCTH